MIISESSSQLACKSGLFCFAEACHADIVLQEFVDHWTPSGPGSTSIYYAPVPEDIAAFVQIQQYLERTGKAKDISIWFTVSDTTYDEEVDFSQLDGAIIVDSKLTEFSATLYQYRPSETFKMSFAIEVKKLGTPMMGAVTEPVLFEGG